MTEIDARNHCLWTRITDSDFWTRSWVHAVISNTESFLFLMQRLPRAQRSHGSSTHFSRFSESPTFLEVKLWEILKMDSIMLPWYFEFSQLFLFNSAEHEALTPAGIIHIKYKPYLKILWILSHLNYELYPKNYSRFTSHTESRRLSFNGIKSQQSNYLGWHTS